MDLKSFNSSRNSNSRYTAKERQGPSFPTKWLFRNGYIKGKVLDFGCGYGSDVAYLEEKGFKVVGYDPYYRPAKPEGLYDTIICHYVLNVLFADMQSQVLMDVSELLKPGGTAYFTVRRDVKYEGFRMHKVHKKRTYQCNVKLPYKTLFENDFCEIYVYRRIIDKSQNSRCVFCAPTNKKFITESALSYAIYDGYPVSDGHALILPKRHIANFFELTWNEQQSMLMLANRVQEILLTKYNPDGFNIGVNAGKEAGQSVFHAHMHIIPRYKGDVENPRGGVRHVIPGKGNY